MREIGVLLALGFSIPQLRAIFLLEGAALAAPGAVVGMGAALAYGGFIMLGLRTWGIDAGGTRLLSPHPSIASLALGAAAGKGDRPGPHPGAPRRPPPGAPPRPAGGG